MNEKLYQQWKKDEQALFTGWDFSYLGDRWFEEQPPWNYKEEAKRLLGRATAVLDMGTGGGEVLASLAPFPKHIVATEGYPPNVEIVRVRLEPLGVKIVAVDESGKLPFNDGEFDLVLNRHSAFEDFEVFRILRKGGTFLTQQVSGNNLEDLIQEFGTESQFKNWSVNIAKQQLERVGFLVERADEWSGKLEFKDVGAIVYFMKAIPWIVKDFSIDKHFSILEKLQRRLKSGRKLVFTQRRFLIKASK